MKIVRQAAPILPFLLALLVLPQLSCAYKAAAPSRFIEGRRDSSGYTGREQHAQGTTDFLKAQLSAALQRGAGGSEVHLAPINDTLPQSNEGRKIIRNGSLELLVNDVGQSVAKISALTKEMGGYVEKSTQTEQRGRSADMTIRVPADRLDQAMEQIKKLATHVDREATEAQDVTRAYVDLDARLSNAKAEEGRYLEIMKRTTTVKDVLEVTEKLSDVQGRIEQLQGEMNYMNVQILLSPISISLRSEAEAAVAGVRWQPLRQAKVAVSDLLTGLADWADEVIAFFIDLPLYALWLLTLAALAFVVWRVLRFLWRKVRAYRKPVRVDVPGAVPGT